MDYKVKILSIAQITHDTKSIIVEKPKGYKFIPGNATEVSINKPGLEDKKRCLTFTSLNDSPTLEFIVKIYEQNNGITKELGKLKLGNELIIGDPWGAMEYKGTGYFIAGGSGITPFIAILRQLKKENKLAGNKLFFSNKTSQDVILNTELINSFGKDAIFIITKEDKKGFDNRYIDENFLKKEVSDFKKEFYICGPPTMVSDINNILIKTGVSSNSIVFEK